MTRVSKVRKNSTVCWSSKEIHDYLADRLKSILQANSVLLVGADARQVNTSRAWPPLAIESSDRDFYTYFRKHDDEGAFITVPVSPIRGYSFSRAASAGLMASFLGIVLGMIEARYF